MSSVGTPRRRRYDPARRRRIAEAAVRVVARDGVDELTHRAVAEEADVPLGSMTYHFADKDDLLRAAVEVAEAANRDMLARTLEAFQPSHDLAGAMARLVEHLTGPDRKQLELDYELYLAARRREALRPCARRWIDDCYELTRRYTDERTAAALSYLLDGMLVQSVVAGEPIDASAAAAVMRRVINGP
ncbi:MAG TPA: TetR family transcriptional regulator [Solirubrobacteraceae bacterium]|nr:TetR family transcriptional regulator [Solirubrobacteraceae bacterium]